MVKLTIPHVSQQFVDKNGILTRPWQRFLSQLFQRTGEKTDKVASGVNTGDLKATAASTAPTGWLICNGAAKSRTTFSDLFTAIGTTYGVGDGSTTFNIPDGVGRVLVGAGTGAGLTPRTRGDEDGEEDHVITLAEMANHGHGITGSGSIVGDGAGTEYVTTAGNKGATITLDTSGADQAHNTMQPFFVANWVIKT
jgi:microcystin-dependent protein